MYKIASQNAQRRADHIKIAELAGGDEIMTPQQQYEAAKTAWRAIFDERERERDPIKRKELGIRMLAAQAVITEARKLAKMKRPGMDISHYIADATKQMVSHAMWHAIVKRAEELRAMEEAK